MASIPSDAQVLLGQQLDQYQLESYIGSGAFSYVFGATLAGGHTVAIKILQPSRLGEAAATAEFTNESRLLQLLTSRSHVVDILDSGTAMLEVPLGTGKLRVPFPFIVLEVAAGSLEDLLLAPIPWTDRIRLFRHAALGVHQCHLSGVVHRDVKSSNVLVLDKSGPYVGKVSDFGRSQELLVSPTQPEVQYLIGRGDPRFAPPECIVGLGSSTDYSQLRVDLYLLGSLLFELATGHAITAFVLPYLGHSVTAVRGIAAVADRGAEFGNRIAEFRSYYEIAFQAFELTVPPVIRNETSALVRQLCDPAPDKRDRRYRADGPPRLRGLEWLLRRVDILSKRLSHASSNS